MIDKALLAAIFRQLLESANAGNTQGAMHCVDMMKKEIERNERVS